MDTIKQEVQIAIASVTKDITEPHLKRLEIVSNEESLITNTAKPQLEEKQHPLVNRCKQLSFSLYYLALSIIIGILMIIQLCNIDDDVSFIKQEIQVEISSMYLLIVVSWFVISLIFILPINRTQIRVIQAGKLTFAYNIIPISILLLCEFVIYSKLANVYDLCTTSSRLVIQSLVDKQHHEYLGKEKVFSPNREWTKYLNQTVLLTDQSDYPFPEQTKTMTERYNETLVKRLTQLEINNQCCGYCFQSPVPLFSKLTETSEIGNPSCVQRKINDAKKIIQDQRTISYIYLIFWNIPLLFLIIYYIYFQI